VSNYQTIFTLIFSLNIIACTLFENSVQISECGDVAAIVCPDHGKNCTIVYTMNDITHTLEIPPGFPVMIQFVADIQIEIRVYNGSTLLILFKNITYTSKLLSLQLLLILMLCLPKFLIWPLLMI